MGQHPATYAEAIAFVTAGFVVYAAVAMARALYADATGASLPSGTFEAVAFVLVALVLVAASGYIFWLSRSAEQAELDRTRLAHARQAERNATIISGSLLVASVFVFALVALAAAGAATWRDALATVAALGLLELVWYAASTIPYAPLPRLPPVK